MHLNTSKINNSPHKLGFQITMRAGDQKLRYDLVWPNSELNFYKTRNLFLKILDLQLYCITEA